MKRSDWYRMAPLLVLIGGLVLAACLGWRTLQENQKQAETTFKDTAERAAIRIQRRLKTYEYGLRGERGALIGAGDEKITRPVFLRYTQSRLLETEFPGARGFGFIRRVPTSQEKNFIAAARKDGWPDFKIREISANTGERFVIQYLEPVERNRAAIGLDIASETNRRTAALRAMWQGEAAITEPITLVQADGKKNSGFLILLAAYREGMPLTTQNEREAAAYGWAYAPLTIDEVMADFDYLGNQIAISIHDYNAAPAEQTFFSSTGMSAPNNPSLKSNQLIQVAGREWTVDVQAMPAFIDSLNQDSPWTVTLVVSGLTALLALLTSILQLANERSLKLSSASSIHRINERYRNLVDNAEGYGIIQLDLAGCVTSWNIGAERIKGYRAEEIMGRHFSIFYPPELLADGYLDEKLKHVRERGSDHDEGWRLRKDGGRFWASVSITPLRDVDGRLIGYSKFTRDLTERREQEAALQQLSATQKAILDNAGIAIIATTESGVITLFNPSAERLLGYPSGEMIANCTPAVFHDVDEVVARAHALTEELGRPIEPGFEAFVAKARLGEVDTNEWSYLTKAGERRPVLLSVTGLFGATGNLYGFVGLAVDLTEQKARESEIEMARDIAEQATRAKSDFLANMSHEIRTPMNAILGMTQLVLQSDLKPQQRDHLSKAFSASKALLTILNDILDYSKIESGHMDLEQQEMSIEATLSNTLALFSAQAEQKGLELLLDISSELPPTLLGDPLRLSQVLANLLGNAIKFTAQGVVTLKVEWAAQGAKMSNVRFSISDTGIGMSADQTALLFTPFTQADTSITRRFGGTGLGLSISKNLVELMGGTLSVVSSPGQGSTFSFEVSFINSPEEKKANPSLQQIGLRRALVVDDQHSAAVVLKLQLNSWGVLAHIANSGQAALAMLETAERNGESFELILLDWKMPGMDGITLAHAIQSKVDSGIFSHMPLIMMVSAYSREELLRQIRHLRVAAVLSKPVMPSMLFNTLLGINNKTLSALTSGDEEKAAHAQYTTMSPALQGVKILLAEDNQLNQQVASAFLQAAGMIVTIAENGRRALELAATNQFDAVLMDMQMPEMDGIEATRQIRALPHCADLPILAMTAAVMANDRKRCLDAGMNEFIAKPIEPEVLIQALCKWVKPEQGIANTTIQPTLLATLNPPLGIRTHSGIDVQGALNRMAGNANLYRELLLNFAARCNVMQAEIKTHSDVAQLSALIHQIKGETANLGLYALADLCLQIETELTMHPEDKPAETLQGLHDSLAEMAALLTAELSKSNEAASPILPRALTPEEQSEVVKKTQLLLPMLSAQRMQALALSEQLQAHLAGTTHGEAYEAIHQLVKLLKFKQAHDKLSKLIAENLM